MNNLIFSHDTSQAQLASTPKSGKLRFFSGWIGLRVSSRFGLDGRKWGGDKADLNAIEAIEGVA